MLNIQKNTNLQITSLYYNFCKSFCCECLCCFMLFTIGLTCPQYIHLSFSNYIINYYFCWGKFSVLCKNKKSELSFWKDIGEGILAFSFIIVFIIFFKGLKIYFRNLTLHLVKRNITDYYRIGKCRRKSQPSLIFLVATSNLLTIEKPLKC